ncbi:MAG: DotI/IcmL family type IV secretion protein [Alphaproteobacteria bacterium]|nr:DotI/IcmL family type IV secretion protein [Alphaproteobacteria bacterium]
MMRFLFVLMVLLVAAPAAHAAGLKDFFFPMLKEETPDPTKTLQAPFAQQPEQPPTNAPAAAASAENSLPQNAVPLQLPHRSTEQIGQWAVMAVSEALTIEGADMAAHLQKIRPHFEPSTFAAQQQFYADSGIAGALADGRYQLRSFVQSAPLLLNEGAVEGRYRWLFEVPVMLSYLPRGAQEYQHAEPINRNLRLTVQVGRSAQAPGMDGVWIEYWRVAENKASQ